jgi:hypothetical protein
MESLCRAVSSQNVEIWHGLPVPAVSYSAFSLATFHKTTERDLSWRQALGICRKNQGNIEATFYTAPDER